MTTGWGSASMRAETMCSYRRCRFAPNPAGNTDSTRRHARRFAFMKDEIRSVIRCLSAHHHGACAGMAEGGARIENAGILQCCCYDGAKAHHHGNQQIVKIERRQCQESA